MPTEQWRKANPDKVRASRRKWYANNKKHAIEKIRERQKVILEWFQNFKATLKCEACPQDHPAVLTFHHINPEEKETDLAHAAHDGWSKERIMKEVSKCKVLCRNCHAILHWKERQE